MEITTKQIVFAEKGRAEVLTAAVPDPAVGTVRVRLEYSAISSGTERANLIGTVHNPVWPNTQGYSSSGIVTDVGPGVTKVRPGDRVALRWSVHAQAQAITENKVLRLADGVDMRAAALFHIASFPLAAIRKCRLEIGESALVMGQGILGMLAIPLLRQAGAVPVIAADPVPEKREKALRLGADYALDPLSPDFPETVKKITGGGAHTGIEVTGVGAGLNEALDAMRRFGRIALLGCTRNSEFTVDYYHKVHIPGITLVGAHTNARPSESYAGNWTCADDMTALMRLSEGGRIALQSMVEEVHSPDEAPAVYRRLAEDGSFPIVLFDWRNG